MVVAVAKVVKAKVEVAGVNGDDRLAILARSCNSKIALALGRVFVNVHEFNFSDSVFVLMPEFVGC